jgi:inner membrane protein
MEGEFTMMGPTHLATGVLVSAAITTNPMGILVGAIASLLPDIDEPTSMISRRVPILPSIFAMFGHRKITHSLLGLFLFSLVVFFIAKEYLLVFMAAYLSHLILDSLTPMGVPWGYPIVPKHFSYGMGLSGGVIEATNSCE